MLIERKQYNNVTWAQVIFTYCILKYYVPNNTYTINEHVPNDRNIDHRKLLRLAFVVTTVLVGEPASSLLRWLFLPTNWRPSKGEASEWSDMGKEYAWSPTHIWYSNYVPINRTSLIECNNYLTLRLLWGVFATTLTGMHLSLGAWSVSILHRENLQTNVWSETQEHKRTQMKACLLPQSCA